MLITFKNAQLRTMCNDFRKLVKKHGERRAKLVMMRLQQFQAMSSLAEAGTLPQLGCHELTGDRIGYLAVNLDHPQRLVFTVDQQPFPAKEDGGWIGIWSIPSRSLRSRITMANARKDEFAPNVVFPPGETLLETIDAVSMSQKVLALRMGVTEKHVNEIIKGKASISEETALKLERVLGVPASFWRNLEHSYRTFLARQEEIERLKKKKAWLTKFPVKEMITRGWIDRHDDPVNQQQELLGFFGVANWGSWENVWTNNATYRRSPAFESNPNAVAAWLRKGELLAQSIACAPFDSKRFKEALRLIRHMTADDPEVFCPNVQELCASSGVAVIFLPELPGMRVSGATWWLKNKAVIQLSARFKSDDQLWFSFFHEAGHVILHGKKEIFIEDHGAKEQDHKEQEANRFAADFLIPPAKWAGFIASGRPTLDQIQEFASRLHLAPGILVGRLQHEGILPFNTGNQLKKRYVWNIENGSSTAGNN